MNLKKLYYYWFFKYYSFLEKYDQTKWLSQTKAIIIITTLEIWLIGSFYAYAKILAFNYTHDSNLSALYWVIPTCVFVIINVVAFNNYHWKEYVQEFDQWDNARNDSGAWIVAFLTVAIFLSFLCAGILLRHINGWPL